MFAYKRDAARTGLPYNSHMPNPHWLTNHLLIAMPSLQDPNFHRSVTYVCQHNEQGAMGLVINRGADLSFGDVLRQLQIQVPSAQPDKVQVLIGGPVQQERGFVLHSAIAPGQRSWDSSFRINEQLCVTTSRDVLEALSKPDISARALLALGYAGWDAGQLENELMENAWLTAEVHDHAILFDIPIEHRWQAAAALVGVDINRITPLAGHA
jgi:putative transcriptional regulator